MADEKRGGGNGPGGKGESARQRISLGNRERYLMYLAVGIILIVVASAVLLVEGHSTALSKCKGVLLSGPRDTCMVALAVSSNNASVCNYVSPGNQQCIVDVAEHYGSQSTCNLLANGTYKYQCTLNVSLRTGNPSACTALGNYTSQCYYSYAKQNKFSNATICSYMSNLTEQAYCDAVSNYNLAINTGNQSYCTHVTNTTDSKLPYLLFNYSSTGANSTSYLYYEYYNFTPRAYCYFNLALKYNSTSACDTIGGTIGSLCNGSLEALAQQKKNSTQTFNLTSILASCNQAPGAIQQVCSSAAYTAAAELYDNVSYCSGIGNSMYYYSCIDAMVQYYNNTSYCSYIKNSTAQSSCYS